MYKPTIYPQSAHLKMLERRQNDQQNSLLALSERLSDNANSMRHILEKDPSVDPFDEDYYYSTPRKSRPCDDIKTGRIVGVSSDLKQQIVDDEYPKKKRQRSKSESDSFLSFFEPQKFDSLGLPSAPNDIYDTTDKSRLANIERNFSYGEGWSNFNDQSMDYGVVPKDQLTHINQVPDYSIKGNYGYNNPNGDDTVRDIKREIFTGDMKSTWKKKQETKPFFTPVNNAGFVYGNAVYDDNELERYLPSRYRQNERLFDPIRVTPGVNLDANEIGTHGNFSLYQARPKTVDELRTKNNPKISYEGRMVSGMRGRELPVMGKTTSTKMNTFKINTQDDLLPNGTEYKGPRANAQVILKHTTRPETSTEYTGGAYASNQQMGRNVPEYMREKVRESSKQNFFAPEPMHKYGKDHAAFDTTGQANSYNLQFGNRSQTGQNNFQGAPGSSTMAYSNIQDEMRATLRSLETKEAILFAPIKSNTMRGTTAPMDIAKTTLKEQTVAIPLNPMAPSFRTMQKVYNNDSARATQRETLPELEPSNLASSSHMYTNLADLPKATMKESTIQMHRPTFIDSHTVGQAPMQDIAKTTMKEGRVHHNFRANTSYYEKTPTHLQDNLRPTMKESTIQLDRPTFINMDEKQAVHYQDFAKPTMKESTVSLPRNMFFYSNEEKTPSALQDNLRTTMKESRVTIPYNMMMQAPNQAGSTYYQDSAKQTTKESTVSLPRHTMINTGVKLQQAPLQDTLRTTTRESTVTIPYNMMMQASNQARLSYYQDTAKATTKESTVELQRNNFITAPNQQIKAPLQD